MNPDWEMVYSSTYPHLAELAKGLLENNEIICVVRNNQDSSYTSIGELEVYVKREDVIKAKFILNQENLE
jgi:hypothetical protein